MLNIFDNLAFYGISSMIIFPIYLFIISFVLYSFKIKQTYIFMIITLFVGVYFYFSTELRQKIL